MTKIDLVKTLDRKNNNSKQIETAWISYHILYDMYVNNKLLNSGTYFDWGMYAVMLTYFIYHITSFEKHNLIHGAAGMVSIN